MANAGIGAGAFADAFLKGYTTTKDLQDRAADREQRQQLLDLQLQEGQRKAAEFEQTQAEKTAIANAKATTYGQVGKDIGDQLYNSAAQNGPMTPAQAIPSNQAMGVKLNALQTPGITSDMSPDQQQNMAATHAAAIPPNLYTEKQAATDYGRALMSNAAISPEKAMTLQLGGLQLNEAKRKVEAQDKWDTESKKFYDIKANLLNQDPVNDPTRFFNEVKADYAKFHPNDKVDMLHGKIIVTDPSGATKAYTPQEAHSNLISLLDDHMKSQFMMMLGSPEAYLAQANKETELGLKKKEVENTGKYQDVMGAAATKTAANGAITAGATAELSHAHAEVYKGLIETAKTNKLAGEAMQPFIKEFTDLTPEEQSGDKGQAVLLKAATAGARVSKDLSSIVATLRKPDRSQVNPEESKAAYTDLSNAGTDPKEIQKVKDKWPNVFGPDALETAVKEGKAKEKANGSTPTPAPQKQALPTGTQQELASQVSTLDSAIADVRKNTTLKTPAAERAEAAKKMADLQKQRDLYNAALAQQKMNDLRTPKTAIDTGVAHNLPNP
jgi:hypothetical protein